MNGFKKASAFLETGGYGLVGYILKNTLSENGGVTRGICTVENGALTAVYQPDERMDVTVTAWKDDGVTPSPSAWSITLQAAAATKSFMRRLNKDG